jgi:adenosylmethionine-8-amino-7-oxononanoate aminotransferase
MHAVADRELVIRSGRGVVITDVDGRDYLDATASLWYCNVGFGRTEIAERVAAQLARLSAYSNFGAFATESSVALADRLAALSPMPESVVFLGSGGSDAVDSAAKLARRYWDLMGSPERRLIVSREHSYHGMHGWGTSLAGIPGNKAGYGGAFIDEVVHVGVADTEALGALFERRGHEIAAFIGEPVIGAGGVIPPEPGYWAEVNRLCREHDILLIADEVITGFGRVGEWFGSLRYGIEPDMITFAKGVSSGYLPIGGVLVGRRVRSPFWDQPLPGAVFRHGYTYGGHAAAAEAALANLDILEREDLIGRVRQLTPVLDRAVRRLADAPLVGEIRTVGLTAAVALRSDLVAADPALADKVAAASIRHGVATRSLRGHAIQVSPAFVIEEAELDAMVDGFRRALEEVAAGSGPGR